MMCLLAGWGGRAIYRYEAQSFKYKKKPHYEVRLF